MFTGIVEKTGKVVSLTSPNDAGGNPVMSICQLLVDVGEDYKTQLGDSVSVNGCCLTVTTNKFEMLSFDVSAETLAITNLRDLTEGDEVNLERALKLGDRVGGHFVSGHVDGMAVVEAIDRKPDGWILTVSTDPSFSGNLLPKGSVCLNGISLTIVDIEDQADQCLIKACLVPTTVTLTNIKHLEVGDSLNLELDLLTKAVAKQI